ncbi:MAG: hypothetical protein RMI39_02275 [Thermoanaerobaculum sp.]|nr:hypothetical protein [Thermoanaerobaculum sp.]
MRELAAIKIAFRTVLPLGTPGEFYDRHFLGYPVTKHTVKAWGPQRRLAGQLRFKVHAVQGANAREVYLPMAFHLPHRLPRELEMSLDPVGKKKATLENQIRVWREVHKVLDEKMRRATF